MSKAGQFARILKNVIKFIAVLLVQITRLILAYVPHLVRRLFQAINARLRFSITFKTTVTYAAIFSTILIILGTLLISCFGFFLLYQANKSLAMNSQAINSMIDSAGAIPADQIREYSDIYGIAVTIFGEEGNIIYTTDTAAVDPTASPTRISPTTSIDDRIHYEYTTNLTGGIGKIEVAQPLAEQAAYLIGLITAIAFSFFIAISLTILIGSRTSRKMLRPIDNMTRTAKSISVGDLHTRLDVVDSHDELKELAETFNAMLDRIQASFDQQNTFVSDASHELRTPLAVIQGYANLLQRWGKEDKAVLQESLDAIKSEADYMKDMVDKLLFLASTDKKQQQLETAPFSINELIEEIVKDSRIIDSRHQITGKVDGIITLNGDRSLIKQALRIFLDNSIKYTPADGAIDINCELHGDKAVIVISDTGQGIAAEDLPHIFNRFYKADKSRTREKGGAGLGLAIAQWIIEQHHGKIKVESTPGLGTRVITTLPASIQR
ncbi:MAG: ATP-binding protein [Syntrophomonadaceae bacterium]|nr:ATP-binding protein [Syntrophomonadaceae bacterium]